MKYPVLLMLTMIFVNCNSSKEKATELPTVDKTYPFFVGTYTWTDAGSKGIYAYEMSNTGILSKIGVAAHTDSPSFLTKTSDGKYLLAVNEVNSVDGKGTVESYKIDGTSLVKLSTSGSGGAHPCHISTNSQGQVVVANYSGGNVGLLNVSSRGTLSDLLDVEQHKGKGTTDRQEGPHAHSAWFRPDGKGIISVDLGTNELWFSNIAQNKLTPKDPPRLAMAPGAGPRHLDFHPNGKFIYVLNELDNTVGLLNLASDGSIATEEVYNLLPEGFTDSSKAADIHVSKDGLFLYATNRGHNSIAVFTIDVISGSLTHVERESTRGDGPRNFKLTNDGKFLVVSNQETNNIVSYSRDAKTGMLEFVSEIECPTPVCILF